MHPQFHDPHLVALVDHGGVADSACQLGAVAYYLLRAVPWLVLEAGLPDSRAALLRLHERMRDAPLVVRNPHFMLVARRPG